jgi:hypothetical protein
LKFLILTTIIIGLFSCNNNPNNINLKENVHNIDSNKIIWVTVNDTLSNSEALLSTNYLPYYNRMSLDFVNQKKNYWQSIDTIRNNNFFIQINKRKGCKISDKALLTEVYPSLEENQYTINKKINKVIEFSGYGSGYMASSKCIYNRLGNLIEYINHSTTYHLKYDIDNHLIEVLTTTTAHGIRLKTGLLKFRKI